LERNIKCSSIFAVRSTFHTKLKNTPEQKRDMIFNIKHEANWEFICKRKQQLNEKNYEAKYAKHIPHTYNIGDKVLIRRGTENKYEAPYEGPYTITQVIDNGTTVRLKVNNVEDTYNIWQLSPYLRIDHGGECSMWTSRVKRRHTAEST
jgi:hypothetical protein